MVLSLLLFLGFLVLLALYCIVWFCAPEKEPLEEHSTPVAYVQDLSESPFPTNPNPHFNNKTVLRR